MKKIILDTDLGGDCDDAAAIALVNKFHNKGLIDCKAILYSNSNKKAAETVDIIDRFYGNTFPCGIYSQSEFLIEYSGDFIGEVHAAFEKKYPPGKIEDANALLYKTLMAEEGKFTVICIGQLRNIAVFLNSDFNGIGGKELFNKKVEKIVIMGGNFDQTEEIFTYCGVKLTGEYNFVTDISSVRTVIEKCTVPIYFCDVHIGLNELSLAYLSENYDDGNPVSMCYKLFVDGARNSWDPLTVLFAIEQDERYFVARSGWAYVDEKGRSLFKRDVRGRHYVVRYNNRTSREIVKYLEDKFKEE